MKLIIVDKKERIMEALSVLEDKIRSLVTLVKELKTQNEALQVDRQNLEEENEELKADNAKFAEDNAQLTAQLKGIEESILKENKQVEALSQERSITKAVVDDLIKSIDILVEHENQQ